MLPSVSVRVDQDWRGRVCFIGRAIHPLDYPLFVELIVLELLHFSWSLRSYGIEVCLANDHDKGACVSLIVNFLSMHIATLLACMLSVWCMIKTSRCAAIKPVSGGWGPLALSSHTKLISRYPFFLEILADRAVA